MRLLDEPSGWKSLQYMAQQETDPEKLECILESVSRLLDQHEKMNACGQGGTAEVGDSEVSIRRAA